MGATRRTCDVAGSNPGAGSVIAATFAGVVVLVVVEMLLIRLDGLA